MSGSPHGVRSVAPFTGAEPCASGLATPKTNAASNAQLPMMTKERLVMTSLASGNTIQHRRSSVPDTIPASEPRRNAVSTIPIMVHTARPISGAVCVVAVCAAVLLSVSVRAQTNGDRRLVRVPGDSNGRRIALVVANDAYKPSPLTNAVNDGRAVAG